MNHLKQRRTIRLNLSLPFWPISCLLQSEIFLGMFPSMEEVVGGRTQNIEHDMHLQKQTNKQTKIVETFCFQSLPP